MRKRTRRIITLNMLPPLAFFALLSAYSFLILIPGLQKAGKTGEGAAALLSAIFPYTAGLMFLTAVLFILLAVRATKMELSREKLKESADRIDEEFQSWVETTADGFIYIADTGTSAADRIVLEMLDCTEVDFENLKPGDYINTDVDGKELLGFIADKSDDITGRYETRLIGTDGIPVEVLISASRIKSESMTGVILIVKDMSDHARTGAVRIDVQREYSIVELRSALQYIYQNAGTMMAEPLLIDEEELVIDAVKKMNTQHKNSFIVVDDAGFAAGVVTDQDLRQRILSGDKNITDKVTDIMSCPVVSASVDIMFFEAFRLMRDNSIRQLVIDDADGRPVGLLTEKNLIAVQSTNTAAFEEELLKAETVDEMRDCYRRLVFSVRTLVLSGAKASYIISLVSKTAEIITDKLIKLAFIKLGPPACDFAFIAMGSEGRGEQTLLTDQDNGIIFEDGPETTLNARRAYFLKLGAFVSDALNHIGYNYCSGGVMASNPKWVKTGNEWAQQIWDWFSGNSPDRLLDLNILFDFKCVYGDKKLAETLRMNIWKAVDSYPGFLKEIAAAVSVFKPRLTIFGRIQVERTDADDEVFNIKKALGPLTIYARTMALKESIAHTATSERLKILAERGVITGKQYRDYSHAFDFLTQLRFRDQVQTIEDGEKMNNLIYIEDLSEVEIISLRKIFKQISSAQDNLRLALTGSIRQI
ncbi:MAG: DUF294 nucleotidyltransferase-like domain-containing protein [Spirochaetales bacterium]|uniref:DUF294 nucleotidyltransferase-like domain-containing protein n=1 Tax=Candidatus Thalassospirochaeta sargassi TaxID=3119039 RepID=A0AAJ1IFE9_9SPIO|nr:DUF294 nucleotidyltransferase-like domain-containing protein [Spirochaetales bacterium]